MEPIVLTASDGGSGPRLTQAAFRPDRGLMLSRLTAELPGFGAFDLVADRPPPDGTDDYVGNASFAYGGAFLVPYANRIRGIPGVLPRTIETEIAGRTVTLPANWSGKAPGAELYAMHGLILDQTVDVGEVSPHRLRAGLAAGDFSGRWLSSLDLRFDIGLQPDRLDIEIAARNVGRERCPVGIGWHPYFDLPSGDRAQARLHVAAERRLDVADYDAVLPTGRSHALAGSPYDFAEPAGRRLGDLYLDDCFVQLKPRGGVVASVVDPAADLSLTLHAAETVKAVQVYAPPDKPFVVVEPQYNWADPFGEVWAEGTDTGMQWLEPGAETRYVVSLRIGRAQG